MRDTGIFVCVYEYKRSIHNQVLLNNIFEIKKESVGWTMISRKTSG